MRRRKRGKRKRREKEISTRRPDKSGETDRTDERDRERGREDAEESMGNRPEHRLWARVRGSWVLHTNAGERAAAGERR